MELIAFSHAPLFENNIMKDLSCRIIKGVTQNWPPFSYITKKPGDQTAFWQDNLILLPLIKPIPRWNTDLPWL